MTRATLTQAENYALCSLIEREYVSSGLNDVEFAAYAAEVLLNPKINRDHIEQRRPIFNLPNNQTRVSLKNSPDLTEVNTQIALWSTQIVMLEKRVASLEFKLAQGVSK